VLAADRVTPGDDAAVAASLERLLATLDLAVELLARGDAAREVEAVRTVPLTRLHRLGVSLVGKVRRLALTLTARDRSAPPAARSSNRTRPSSSTRCWAPAPCWPGIIDDPPSGKDRPMRSLADLARATAAVESAAAGQALLLGLGVTPALLAPGSPLLEDTGVDDAALDAGLLARTALVQRLLRSGSSRNGNPPMIIEALDAKDVRDFQALLEGDPVKLPEVLKKKVKAILDAATPTRLAGAAAGVAERWLAGLAPLEPVLVRKPPPTKTRRRS
jgi:hypothetical protein